MNREWRVFEGTVGDPLPRIISAPCTAPSNHQAPPRPLHPRLALPVRTSGHAAIGKLGNSLPSPLCDVGQDFVSVARRAIYRHVQVVIVSDAQAS